MVYSEWFLHERYCRIYAYDHTTCETTSCGVFDWSQTPAESVKAHTRAVWFQPTAFSLRVMFQDGPGTRGKIDKSFLGCILGLETEDVRNKLMKNKKNIPQRVRGAPRESVEKLKFGFQRIAVCYIRQGMTLKSVAECMHTSEKHVRSLLLRFLCDIEQKG